MMYYDPHKTINHSRYNRKFSRWFYWIIYAWNCYILKKQIFRIESWISISWGCIEHNNWGDDINMFFVRKLSSDCLLPGHAYAYPDDITFRGLLTYTPIYAIGSVFHLVNQENSIVWGSGLLNESYLPTIKSLDIRAVRGPLTRQVLVDNGYKCPEVYGDPALLLPHYYMPKNVKKRYKLGIIPHYVDSDKDELIKFHADKSVIIIRMSGYKCWESVIDQIISCEFIASSSLHGLIVAEAYKVPNLWIEIKEPIIGDIARRFKFHDFFQSIGLDRESPYLLCGETTILDILSQRNKYQEAPGIDLKPLVEACPFHINRQFRF